MRLAAFALGLLLSPRLAFADEPPPGDPPATSAPVDAPPPAAPVPVDSSPPAAPAPAPPVEALAVDPPPGVVVQPSVAPQSWWTGPRTTGVVMAGVGLAAVALGIGIGLAAKGNYDDARASCADAPRGCPSAAVRDADSAYGLAAGATVLFVSGAALAVAGTAMIVFSPSPPSPQAGAPRAATTRAALQVGPGSVAFVGRW